MADKKKMSVAEILAAARKADGDGASADAPDTDAPAEAQTAETAAPPESAPSAAAKPVAKPGSKERPSATDILAMARAGNSGAAGKPEAKSTGEKPKAKSAAKSQAAAKPPAKKGAAAAAEPRDTASILAAARKENKPGPMSKAEAATKAKSDPTVKAKPAIVVPPMPTKPDYAKPDKAKAKPVAKTDGDEERRDFLAIGFWTVGIVSFLWIMASVKFFFPNVRREPPSQFKVGGPDAFPPGQVETKYKAQFGVWVINTDYNGQQQLFALKSVCTHLGCTPNWLEAEQKFKCPCHGSGFYKDGVNFEGPAPRPLERYAIQIASDGQVEIDKSRTFQEEMGQWEDPTCYIPV